jgi:hypothetical protein
MRTEINHHIAIDNDGAQIVAGINLPGDFDLAKMRRAGDERLTHAAFHASNNNFCHNFNAKPQSRPEAKRISSSNTLHLRVFALKVF